MDALLLKAAARGREALEKRAAERTRGLLVLILRHLTDHGYIEAAERLSTECSISLTRCDAADNISLLQILQDWEETHEQRYGRRPKLVKQLEGAGSRHTSRQPSQHALGGQSLCPAAPISGQLAALQRRDKAAAAAAGQKLPPVSRSSSQTDRGSQHNNSSSFKQEQQVAGGTAPNCSSSNNSSNSNSRQQSAGAASSSSGGDGGSLEVSGQGCELGAAAAGRAAKQRGGQGGCSSSADGSDDESNDTWAARLLKPLPTTLLGELRQLGAAISQDIYLESPNVKFADIAGLADAKRLLQESVGLPMKYPQLFTGLLAPWRGVLLYGPPGTGKTLLAKAVATSCRTTFFNISASSIVSKWRGDSEKLVRVLFDLARHHAPATIFLDEVDALMGARGVEGEHEASRRMKMELLIQMDGLCGNTTRSSSGGSGGSGDSSEEPQVFVLAASNLPWDLDQALLRRLQKRILVPLPDSEARSSMLRRLLADRLAPGVALEGLVAATEGFSGSDITLLAKEAAMRPLRRLLAALEPSVYDAPPPQPAATAAAAAAAATSTTPSQDASTTTTVELGPVSAEDLAAALLVTKPSAQGYDKQYAEFSSRFGQAG